VLRGSVGSVERECWKCWEGVLEVLGGSVGSVESIVATPLYYVAECSAVLQSSAVCCRVLQIVIVRSTGGGCARCGVLQRKASVLQRLQIAILSSFVFDVGRICARSHMYVRGRVLQTKNTKKIDTCSDRIC